MLFNIFMTRTPSYPEVKLKNSVAEFCQNMRELFSKARMVRILFGTGLFWICGALLKMNFQPWGQQVLKLETMTQISLLGLWLSIGVMIGSLLAGQLYRVGELQATRRYGLLLAISVAVLGSVQWLLGHGFNYPRAISITVLVIAGIFAGLFLIPLNAALQAESHQGKLGKTIATQNGIENAAMLVGGIFAYVNVRIGFDPSQLFLGLAVLVGLVSVWLRIPGKQAVISPTKSQQQLA
jgi:LPLT family lysophospholipid transporter-like MFS transporter